MGITKKTKKGAKKLRTSRTHNKWLYNILNIIIGGLIMLFIYFNYVKDMPEFMNRFLFCLIASLITGVFASWIARLITHYYRDKLNPTNFYYREVFISFFYALAISTGYIANWFVVYEGDWFEIIERWIILKALIFFMSDYFADKLGFGG